MKAFTKLSVITKLSARKLNLSTSAHTLACFKIGYGKVSPQEYLKEYTLT